MLPVMFYIQIERKNWITEYQHTWDNLHHYTVYTVYKKDVQTYTTFVVLCWRDVLITDFKLFLSQWIQYFSLFYLSFTTASTDATCCICFQAMAPKHKKLYINIFQNT